MKLWLFAVFVLSVGCGMWWNLSDHNDQHDAIIDISSINAEPADKAQASETDATEAHPTDARATEATDSALTQRVDDTDQQGEQSVAEIIDTVQEPAVDEDSNAPFSVVGDAPQEMAQNEPANTAPATNQSAAVPQQETQSEPRAVVPINVPDSYPVTEAGKYFIPKEERVPGNLGGPPPLNFPGAPVIRTDNKIRDCNRPQRLGSNVASRCSSLRCCCCQRFHE